MTRDPAGIVIDVIVGTEWAIVPASRAGGGGGGGGGGASANS